MKMIENVTYRQCTATMQFFSSMLRCHQETSTVAGRPMLFWKPQVNEDTVSSMDYRRGGWGVMSSLGWR